MCEPDLIEPLDGCRDVFGAVIDIVGDAHCADTGKPQCFTANLRIDKEAFSRMRSPRWQMQAAFQIGEHCVCCI